MYIMGILIDCRDNGKTNIHKCLHFMPNKAKMQALRVFFLGYTSFSQFLRENVMSTFYMYYIFK